VADQREYLRRVETIADIVRADADRAEHERRLGDATVAALRDTGLTRMLLPPRYGGSSLTFGESFAVGEALARVNGSAGWNLNIAITTAAMTLALEDTAVLEEIFGDPATIVAGTINFLAITARRVEGGYVFDGQASFLSGSSHATWLIVGGTLTGAEGRVGRSDGAPVIVRGLVPMAAVVVADTWKVSGMRATASNDAPLRGVFVADRYICSPDAPGLAPGDPAAAFPLLSRFGAGLAFVGLGAARGALDALAALAADKVPFGSRSPLRERGDVQADAGRALGLIEAGRAFVEQTWRAAEDKSRADQVLDESDHLRLRLSYVTAAEHAASAADLVWRAGGSSSLYEANGIERFWRDANAVTKHAAVTTRHYGSIGRAVLGLAPAPGRI